MYIQTREGLEDKFPLSSLGQVQVPQRSAAQAQLPRLARSSRAAQPLRRHPPLRTALGQPATVSANPWPCESPRPPCTTQRVSPGANGTALLWFTDKHCIPNKVPQLLKLSPTFMQQVVELDKRYIALAGPSLCALDKAGKSWTTEWAPNEAGVLTKGPFVGRRVLAVWWDAHGSRFEPAGSLDGNRGFDVIFVQPPSDPDVAHQNSPRVIAEYIAHIAHETTHAFIALKRTGPPPKAIPERVRAAIAEEVATRRTEAKILAEIVKTAAGSALRGAIAGLTGSTETWQVQRDFFPGPLRRTYLEHFVLTELAVEAIQREKLTAADVARIDGEVDALKIDFPSLRSIKTFYGVNRFHLRGIDLRWRALVQRRGGEPRNGDLEKEKFLQEFAANFFVGLVKYDPVPKKP
jgi:hypothetical protein